jgi:hypothetical protein
MTTKRNTVATAVGAMVLLITSLLGAGQAAAGPVGTEDYVNQDVCINNADGRQECFWVGTATGYSVPGAVYHQWQLSPGGSWSGVASLGGTAYSGVDVSRNADGRLEIFVQAAGADLNHKWQTSAGGAWSGWASLGGVIAYGPGVTGPWSYTSGGRIYVDVYGPDGLWHTKYQTQPNCCWSGWV